MQRLKKRGGIIIGTKKPHGHYCKVCGHHKANEKFSGKGHATHICKECSKLSASEKAEAMTLTRLYNLPVGRLNDGDKKWLENRIHDKRPAVKEQAVQIYNLRFPYAKRNAEKKKLQIIDMEFTVNINLWDQYGDEKMVRCGYALNRKESILRKQPLDIDMESEAVEIDKPDTAKLLKWMVHSLEIFCWEDDYCHKPFYTEADVDCLDFMDDFDTEDADVQTQPDLMPTAQEEEGEPTWSVWIQYADGSEQRTQGFDTELPERVEQLYMELADYFPDEDDDEENEFDFISLAYDCSDLNELESLVSNIISDAEESKCDVLVAESLMDIMTLDIGSGSAAKEKKRPYRTYSGASANIKFLKSYLTQAMADEVLMNQGGQERLKQFSEYVKTNFVYPRGEQIASSDLDKTLAAIEKRYGLISRLSTMETLQILRIPNTHLKFNSVCNAAKRINGVSGFRYEIYLFHGKDEQSGHPAYILLHEIGHALQIELTHDPAKIPESFCKMSDALLGKPLEQSPLAVEIFADAFAIAMIRIFGWDTYGTFDNIDEGVKHVFANYMHWLLEKEILKIEK